MEDFKFNVGDKVHFLYKRLERTDEDGIDKRILLVTPKVEITDRIYCDDSDYHGNYYRLEDFGWVLEYNLHSKFEPNDFEVIHNWSGEELHLPIKIQTVSVGVIFKHGVLSDEEMKRLVNKKKKRKITKSDIKVDGDRIQIKNVEFKLVKDSDKIETVNVDKYEDFYNPNKDENEFDLDFEEFSLKDYEPFTKDYVDNHLSISVCEQDEYGTRYNVSTDYWYINLRKVKDMSVEQFNLFVEDVNLDNVVVVYDSSNNLWLVETNED